jgi:hypothetical protein
MKRICLVLTLIALVWELDTSHRNTSAQVVEEAAPVVSTTYIAPPTRQQEVITVAPSPQYVWVAGQWEKTPDNWTWTAGRWVQPPFGNAYWTPGYWKHHGGRYVWQAGHWAAASQGVLVAKPVTVPPIYAEVQPAIPASVTNLVWQPGHWDWRGTWVWVPGEYIQSSVANVVWVPGAWVAGADGLWRWNAAHWANA